jgi:PTH1 family peptidyl-tRNA hydrolase
VRLLVGLGNPGAKYARTRHNVGFRVAEEAARACGVALDQERWGALYGVGRAGGDSLAILLPQTFMNLSGEAVGQAARFWKIDPASVVVAHDELDFEFGRLQVKTGGGDGGHNGLKSLRQHLGTGDFVRVRVGIGRPPLEWDPSDWVLAKLSPEEEDQIEDAIAEAAQAALLAVAGDVKTAMNRFNTRPGAARKKAKEEGTTKEEAAPPKK